MTKETTMYIAECDFCNKKFAANSDFDIEAFFTKEELLEKMIYEDWLSVDKYDFCADCIEKIMIEHNISNSKDPDKIIDAIKLLIEQKKIEVI